MNMEGITFTWNYGKGKMTVYPDSFLRTGTAAQIKKLIKYMRESDTPEVLDEVRKYFEQFNEDYEPAQRKDANIYVALESKVNLAKRQKDELVAYIIRLKEYKKRLKRSNPQWNTLNEQMKRREAELKEFKEELQSIKKDMRKAKDDFESRKRLKDKFDRFTELL